MSYQLQTNTLPTKILYVDSRDADRYLSSQMGSDGNPTGKELTSYFQYILKESIEIPTNQRCLISLDSSTIPYSFYTIRKFVNDLIPMKIVDDDSGLTGNISPGFIIPPANYTAFTLASYLSANIPLATGDTNWNNTFQGNFKLDITFSQDTNKFTYKLTPTDNSKNWSLYFLFDSPLSSERDKYANVETGFDFVDKRIQYASGQDPAYECISDNVIDISGSIHGMYVRTNLVNSGTLDSQNGTFSNILARIPIEVASGGLIFSTPSNNTSRNIVDLRSINSLTIRLTDERNREVDLNGLHFQIAILIEFVYASKTKYIADGRQGFFGDSYGVLENQGNKIQARIERNKILYQQRQEQLEELERQERRRGPGRPRRVGRPRNKRPVGRPVGS